MTETATNTDTEGRFDVRTWDVEYRNIDEEHLMARVYQPQGVGPFPLLLEVHGGVWTGGDRKRNESIDHSLAGSGIVVAAIDFRLAPQYPYPAQVVYVNYATRWLKAHAGELNADRDSVGALGFSSGGHTVVLSAMRPRDARYSALPLEEDPNADATLGYILALFPVLDPYARYLYAQERGLERLATLTEGYFLTEECMRESSPQFILERGETVQKPPILVLQGTADDNIPEDIPRRFVAAYRSAGGPVEIEWFPGAPHGFARAPGADADRALALMKDFVGRHVPAYAAR
ncbi:MAG: alpha/beta hydrolase [Dehalococcoidia bacterium]|nr:alpha/beta hydrolase [Dehalococcoidia bacterium]